MSGPPQAVTSPAESWARSSLDQIKGEAQQFLETFAAFVTRPSRSAHDWSVGTRSFMNPLGFVAAAAGVYWTLINVLEAVWSLPGSGEVQSVAEQIASAIGPQVHYGLLGVAMHFTLRVLGSRRSVLGSVGVSFFVGGSIGTVVALALSAPAQYVGHIRGTGALELAPADITPLALFTVALLSYSALCITMARAMMGLHAARSWMAAVAVGTAILTTAFLFGSVLPEGPYGWHPYLDIDLQEGVSFAFGFRG